MIYPEVSPGLIFLLIQHVFMETYCACHFLSITSSDSHTNPGKQAFLSHFTEVKSKPHLTS